MATVWASCIPSQDAKTVEVASLSHGFTKVLYISGDFLARVLLSSNSTLTYHDVIISPQVWYLQVPNFSEFWTNDQPVDERST